MRAAATAFLRAEPSAELIETLADVWQAALRPWSGLSFEAVPFFDFLGQLTSHQPSGLAALRVEDLLLARAALAHDAAALRHLDAVLQRARNVIERVGDSDFRDEVVQLTRQHLLLAEGTAAPALESYQGRGSLLTWVRAVLYRRAMTAKRLEHPAENAEALAALPDAAWSAELRFIKSAHRQAFAAAFREALSTLTDTERAVLRLNLVERLSIDRLAVLYGTHRATAARWVARARERLSAEVELRLRARLDLDAAEYEGLLRSLQDNLEVSLARLLHEG